MPPNEPALEQDRSFGEQSKEKSAAHQGLSLDIAEKLVSGKTLSQDEILSWIGSFSGSMEAGLGRQILKLNESSEVEDRKKEILNRLSKLRKESQLVSVGMLEGGFNIANVNVYLSQNKERLSAKLDRLGLETNLDEIADTIELKQPLDPLQVDWFVISNLPKLAPRRV